MHSRGLVHSGISWWGVYTVVLWTNIPCSCCKYLAYLHFPEHCQGMESEGCDLCQTTVMALPWCSPAASQCVSPLWWEISAVSCSKRCKGHFWAKHTSTLHVAFLGWKPCGKALRVLLLPDSSALLCGHTTLQRIRCLNRPVLQPVCTSFACCLPGLYPTLLTCPLF